MKMMVGFANRSGNIENSYYIRMIEKYNQIPADANRIINAQEEERKRIARDLRRIGPIPFSTQDGA
jgi:signal transduction histidine kinase